MALRTSIVLCMTSFLLGILFVNWTVDHNTLWVTPVTSKSIDTAADYYEILYTSMPNIMKTLLHVVMAAAGGCLILKFVSGQESNTLFDGASIVLYICGFAIYWSSSLNSIKGLLEEKITMDEKTEGVRVIAASHMILALVLLGVVVLQTGQYYTERMADEDDAEEAAQKKEKNAAKRARKAAKGKDKVEKVEKTE